MALSRNMATSRFNCPSRSRQRGQPERCSRSSSGGSSPAATASSSASSGHVRLEGMAHVLVEIVAHGPDELQNTVGVHVDGVALDLQVASNLGGGPILEQAMFETGPSLR